MNYKTYLESTAHFDGVLVVYNDDAEIVGLDDVPENVAQFVVFAADCCLAELLVGNLASKVGSHEDGAWDFQMPLDDVRYQVDATAFRSIESLQIINKNIKYFLNVLYFNHCLNYRLRLMCVL